MAAVPPDQPGAAGADRGDGEAPGPIPLLIRDARRYHMLRKHYQEQHPRISLSAIDAFVDGMIAGSGVAAGDFPDKLL